MSASTGSGEGGQDFELNLAPIIDCFTVLIAFMLASASFLAIGIFDAGSAQTAEAAATPSQNENQIFVDLKSSKDIEVRVTGKRTQTEKLAHGSDHYPLDRLKEVLSAMATQKLSSSPVILLADGTVKYEELIRAMDILKQVALPVVLGGF